MATDEVLDVDEENEKAYDDLIVAVEASEGILSLFLAVCDSPPLRAETIERYETELQPTIRPYRIELPSDEPSLRKAIAETVANDEYLQAGGRAVLTVVGLERLSFLRMGEERSQQEIFFGYLQWTREGLREFPYPIILWLTNQLFVEVSRKAPDFWSWRKDVFRFRSKKTILVSSEEVKPLRSVFQELEETGIREEDSIPLEDLRQLIAKTEAKLGDNRNDPLLATLYEQMGQIYRGRLDRSEAQNYQEEIGKAIEYCEKAAEIQKTLGLEIDLARSLNNVAFLYRSQGRLGEAEPLSLQALAMRQRLFEGDHPDVAWSLNNVASLYKSQGRLSEAEPLYRQALEMRQRLFEGDHLDVAMSLDNVASLYDSQGRLSEAEPLYRQALAMRQRLFEGDHLDVAWSLNNVASLYKSQGRLSEAELLYRQALAMRQRLFEGDHPDMARSLNNVASLYESQGQLGEAELLYLQALAMRQRLFEGDHPAVARSLDNVASLYKSQGRLGEAEPLYLQALAMRQRLFEGDHPAVARSLNNVASLYKSQGRLGEAEPLYRQALEMFEGTLGANHPTTQIVRKNLEQLPHELRSLKEAKLPSSSLEEPLSPIAGTLSGEPLSADEIEAEFYSE